MFHLRFGHVFFGLMSLSVLSAFVFSPDITKRAQASVQNIFAPVARPVNAIGGWVHAKLSPPRIRDDGSPNSPRSATQVYAENQQLRIEVANLRGLVSRLEERVAERAKLGSVMALCTEFKVIGGDSGPRQSLMIAASSMDGVRDDMPVLYTGLSSGGIAGKVSRAGVGGAQVLLLTDPAFKPFTASFARFITKAGAGPEYQRLTADAFLIEGAGNGQMVMRHVTEKAAQEIGVKVDDWVILSDRDWPAVLDGYRVGRVTAVAPSRNPGFVEIRVEPDADLRQLRHVMVMNKQKG